MNDRSPGAWYRRELRTLFGADSEPAPTALKTRVLDDQWTEADADAAIADIRAGRDPRVTQRRELARRAAEGSE